MPYTTSPVLTDPEPGDIEFLEARLIEFNYRATGFTDGLGLAIITRDEAGNIIAGLSGFTWGGACKIEWLWVREDLRSQGLGRELMRQAEDEAIRRGCGTMLLDTHSFQAPSFYQKLGFEIAGVYEDFPKGYQQVFLQKKLYDKNIA